MSEDQRLHTRIEGVLIRASKLIFDDGEIAEVVNISFSGIAVKLTDDKLKMLRDQMSTSVVLSILGEKIKTQIVLNNVRERLAGCILVHPGIEALLQLRSVLALWKLGTTARLITNRGTEGEPESVEKIFVNAEGPSDLVISVKPEGRFDALFTFLVDGKYAHINMIDGEIQTGVAVGKSKLPGSSVNVHSKPDHKIIRQGIALLAGFEVVEVRSYRDQLIEAWWPMVV